MHSTDNFRKIDQVNTFTDNKHYVSMNERMKGGPINKRQRPPKGQWKMDNPEKLATQDMHDEEKHNTIYVEHHYVQAQIT